MEGEGGEEVEVEGGEEGEGGEEVEREGRRVRKGSRWR